MLLLTTVCLLVIGMSMEIVEAAAKPFHMFNKNLMHGFRPAEDGLRNMDGAGNWARMPNPSTSNGAYQYGKPEEAIQPMNYLQGTNNTLFGIGSVMPNGANLPTNDGQKEADGKSAEPYTMFYRSSRHTRCEECDEHGKIKGTMLVTDHGVQKMINYEALTAKNPEESSTNVNPAQLNSNVAGEQAAVDGPASPVQNVNQIPSQLGERMMMNIPAQMGQQNSGMPQQMVMPPSATSQLPLMSQQNIPLMLAQANSVLQNGMTSQTAMGTFAPQMPAALNNAGQANQQQILQRLVPSSQVGNQMIAQRANEMMSGVYQNQQQPSWNDANRQQIPPVSFVNPSINGGEVANTSPDQANLATLKALLQNGQAFPMLVLSPNPQSQVAMSNLGQTKDNGVAATMSKEMAAELKPSDAGTGDVNELVMKKLTAEILNNMIPNNGDGKDEQLSSAGRR